MDNDKEYSVICQCLGLLDVLNYRSLLKDHRTQKLTTGKTIELHIAAQLLGLGAYEELTETLRAEPRLQKRLQLESISPSRLSTKTREICTASLQGMFLYLVEQLKLKTAGFPSFSPKVKRLCVLDATNLTLPPILAKWAVCSSKKRGVTIHTRLMVVDKNTPYPDRVILSTAHVRERAVVNELLQAEEDITYVMDRGYMAFKLFKQWTLDHIQFVCRIQEKVIVTPVSEPSEIPDEDRGWILRDVEVIQKSCELPLRLVEYVDEKGRLYRLITSRRDLTAAEVAEIYRNRWLVELFFKWIKQHLNVVKLFQVSDPTAVWNQLYIALIAYVLIQLVRLETGTKKSLWNVLQLIRRYAFQPVEAFRKSLERKPSRKSAGRQRVEKTLDGGTGKGVRIIIR